MATLDIFNLKKQKVGSLDLDDAIFAAPINMSLFHEVVMMQRASKRGGNAATKTRGFVRGGGRKPFRQKGTGQARRGSSRSPLLVGGAVTFGPHPRSYTYRLPKKARKAALRSALSLKVKEQMLVVFDAFALAEIKTKEFAKVLKSFGVTKALVVDDKGNLNLVKSARNIANVKVLPEEGINVYDVLRYDHLLASVAAIKKIEGALKK